MVKTVLYVDDDVWQSFKRKVFEEHGTLRVMSKETSRILKDYLMRELPAQLSSILPSAVPRPAGPSDIVAERPKVKVSSAKIIREMRESRRI